MTDCIESATVIPPRWDHKMALGQTPLPKGFAEVSQRELAAEYILREYEPDSLETKFAILTSTDAFRDLGIGNLLRLEKVDILLRVVNVVHEIS